MERAFITGVNGFIGSHLAEELLERGCEVIGLVRPSSDTQSLVEAFRRYGPRFRLVLGDVRDPESLEASMAGADYVYHLAAVLMGTREADFHDTNAMGTCNVLDAAFKCHQQRPLKRVVITSSIAAAGPSGSEEPINEERERQPISWYGESKAVAEEHAENYSKKGLPITIARPVLVYGERDRDFSGGIFPVFSFRCRMRIGSKHKHVSMIYVGDLVEGMIAAAESANGEGNTYFFSDPKPYRDTEVATAVADAFPKRCWFSVALPHLFMTPIAWYNELKKIFTGVRPKLTRDKVRELRQRWWTVSPAAAQGDFDWQASTDIADGMKIAVKDWFARREKAPATLEPSRDRILKTIPLAFIAGIAIEGLAKIGNWWTFTPWWVVLVIVILGFGGVLGGASLLTVARPRIVQFLAGGILGIVGELANALWLDLWRFSPEFVGWLPQNDWLISLAVGLPLGFVPVIINCVVCGIYRRNCRLGSGPFEEGV